MPDMSSPQSAGSGDRVADVFDVAHQAVCNSECRDCKASTAHVRRLQRVARTTSVVTASTAAVPPEDQQHQGFLQKVQKSIRDFGFGKRSFVEGGVGLFVFTGIGMCWC